MNVCLFLLLDHLMQDNNYVFGKHLSIITLLFSLLTPPPAPPAAAAAAGDVKKAINNDGSCHFTSLITIVNKSSVYLYVVKMWLMPPLHDPRTHAVHDTYA